MIKIVFISTTLMGLGIGYILFDDMKSIQLVGINGLLGFNLTSYVFGLGVPYTMIGVGGLFSRLLIFIPQEEAIKSKPFPFVFYSTQLIAGIFLWGWVWFSIRSVLVEH